jgi:hypothetical protein
MARSRLRDALLRPFLLLIQAKAGARLGQVGQEGLEGGLWVAQIAGGWLADDHALPRIIGVDLVFFPCGLQQEPVAGSDDLGVDHSWLGAAQAGIRPLDCFEVKDGYLL